MKWVIYNLLFALAFPLMLPGFLIRMLRRGGYRARMGDRFALYPKEILSRLASGDFVWVHAVSVGEVQVAGQLMREWRAADPSVRFCFSTTSSTGWKMAEKEVASQDVLIYNPLDFPNFVKSALKTIRPRAIVLTESEIWPVFIRKAASMAIPLFLINARVSDRSAPRYAKARFFFADVFRCFTRIFAQSELDKARLVAAGAPEDRIDVTGSFKFDVAHRNPTKEAELGTWIGSGAGRILLGGSTWPGEDEVLLRIYRKLLEKGPARLVLAPRHFEKADAVEANIRAAGFDCIRRSRGESFSAPGANDPSRSVFLADTTGELMGLYGLADAVFVGKSLCEHGSQNMIEPCLCGKPTVVGPNTENFRPVMSDLLEGRGLVQVADESELERTICGWFADGDAGLGERARQAVLRRTGVVPKCTAAIREAISVRTSTPAATFRFGRTLLLSALWIISLAAILLMLLFAHLPVSCPSSPAAVVATARHQKAPPQTKLNEIRTVGAYVAMIERPDAVRVFLADDEASYYAPAFAAAGLTTLAPESAPTAHRYDLVFATVVPADLDWTALLARVGSRGVLACALDVRKMTASRFKAILESFPSPEPHLWMVGEEDWMLTGRPVASRVKMSAMLDFFTDNDKAMSMSSWAEAAGCGSLQGVLANYVGTRAEVLPAFANGDLSASVRPEHFIAQEDPEFAWIVPDGLDADIVELLAGNVRQLLAVRRQVVKGILLARDGKTDEAIVQWSEASRANPFDVMLMDRLYRLAVNARAFQGFGRLAEAAQCYDVLHAIRPNDLSVAEEYHGLLLTLGRKDAADELKAGILRLKAELKAVEEKESNNER